MISVAFLQRSYDRFIDLQIQLRPLAEGSPRERQLKTMKYKF